jgi:2-polyprenyl-6-methoxyphenol hydroxylase-like FAD-dependent oxidoreductase
MGIPQHRIRTISNYFFQVIIVGAGPSGLILSLLLAKEGIEVALLDAGVELDKQPRAAHYASAATYELSRTGVLEDLKVAGFSPTTFAWRKPDTSFIAGINHAVLPEDYPYKMQVLPLDQLGEILYSHLQRQPTASVKWAHRVVKIGQGPDKAWVDVETPDGLHTAEADYVIGCDGASSTVRRELFGPEYPGETLNAQIVATNVWASLTRVHEQDSIF